MSDCGYNGIPDGKKAGLSLRPEERVKKAHLIVTLKPTVLDPQGSTILAALQNQGNESVAQVRQGKFFELQMREGMSEEVARGEVERLAREVFTNPVLEEYHYKIMD